jgi:hypothetical protein
MTDTRSSSAIADRRKATHELGFGTTGPSGWRPCQSVRNTQAPLWHKSSSSRAWGTCRPGLEAGPEGRSAVAAGRAAWGWHGAVSDIFRPARLACHGHDRRGGIAFRGGADRGDLVARLLPDRCSRAFGRLVYGVDLRPRPLRYGGRLAVSQVKDPPRLPERVRVPESPGLLWVSGLL